jgi:hypothetical protein
MSQASIEFAQGPLLVARWDRVVITVVRGQPTVAFCEAAQRLGRVMGARDPGRVGSLTLVGPSGRPPEGAARELAKEYSREANQWIGARATVLTAEGFTGSVARSVLTMIAAFSRGPILKVFSRVDPAVAWLGSQIELTPESCYELAQWCEATLALDALSAASEAMPPTAHV